MLTLLLLLGITTRDVIMEKVDPICNVSMLVVFLPQLYWFWLMMQGAAKLLSPSMREKAT